MSVSSLRCGPSGIRTFTAVRCTNRFTNGKRSPGWISRFGWNIQLRIAECGVRNDESNATAIGVNSCNFVDKKKNGTTNPHENTQNGSATRNPQSAFRDPQSNDSFPAWLKSLGGGPFAGDCHFSHFVVIAQRDAGRFSRIAKARCGAYPYFYADIRVFVQEMRQAFREKTVGFRRTAENV